ENHFELSEALAARLRAEGDSTGSIRGRVGPVIQMRLAQEPTMLIFLAMVNARRRPRYNGMDSRRPNAGRLDRHGGENGQKPREPGLLPRGAGAKRAPLWGETVARHRLPKARVGHPREPNRDERKDQGRSRTSTRRNSSSRERELVYRFEVK